MFWNFEFKKAEPDLVILCKSLIEHENKDHTMCCTPVIKRFGKTGIGARPDEIRYLIYFVDQRNPIRNYQKMKAIITFAIENPWFVGCKAKTTFAPGKLRFIH